MEQRKFVFIREYESCYGAIPKGSEIVLFRNFVYFNGGMVHPAYASVLIELISRELKEPKYLQEVSIIDNKV